MVKTVKIPKCIKKHLHDVLKLTFAIVLKALFCKIKTLLKRNYKSYPKVQYHRIHKTVKNCF